MVRENELRVGNWVENMNRGVRFEISLSDFFEEYDTGQAFFHISPILLTGEILEKCGAVDGVFKIYNKVTLEWDFGNDFWLCKEDEIVIPFENVKYLHQLQNLYFSLTGQELEIKL